MRALYLASPRVFRDCASHPERLERELAAALQTVKTVFLDEVQRVPALLDAVQVSLDERPGRFRFLMSGARLVEPPIDFIRYMPAPVFGALMVAVFGLADAPKVAIIFIGTFFQMVLIVANTTRRLDRSLLEAAQTLGASRRQLVRHVIVPGVLPQLYTDLRILLGWAWTYLIVAELIGAKSGVTAYIAQQGRYFNFDLVYAAIIVIGVIGLVTDQVLQHGARVLFPWQRGEAGPVTRTVWSWLALLPRGAMGLVRRLRPGPLPPVSGRVDVAAS